MTDKIKVMATDLTCYDIQDIVSSGLRCVFDDSIKNSYFDEYEMESYGIKKYAIATLSLGNPDSVEICFTSYPPQGKEIAIIGKEIFVKRVQELVFQYNPDNDEETKLLMEFMLSNARLSSNADNNFQVALNMLMAWKKGLYQYKEKFNSYLAKEDEC